MKIIRNYDSPTKEREYMYLDVSVPELGAINVS